MIDFFKGQHAFLSNFQPCTVWLDDDCYASVEHAYQAAKSFDPGYREIVRETTRPGDVKRFAKTLAAIRPDWDAVRVEIMEDLLRQKFRNPELAPKLLETGDEELVEGNTWGDTFWGVCKGKGENNLGKLLMKIRKELQDAAGRGRG